MADGPKIDGYYKGSKLIKNQPPAGFEGIAHQSDGKCIDLGKDKAEVSCSAKSAKASKKDAPSKAQDATAKEIVKDLTALGKKYNMPVYAVGENRVNLLTQKTKEQIKIVANYTVNNPELNAGVVGSFNAKLTRALESCGHLVNVDKVQALLAKGLTLADITKLEGKEGFALIEALINLLADKTEAKDYYTTAGLHEKLSLLLTDPGADTAELKALKGQLAAALKEGPENKAYQATLKMAEETIGVHEAPPPSSPAVSEPVNTDVISDQVLVARLNINLAKGVNASQIRLDQRNSRYNEGLFAAIDNQMLANGTNGDGVIVIGELRRFYETVQWFAQQTGLSFEQALERYQTESLTNVNRAEVEGAVSQLKTMIAANLGGAPLNSLTLPGVLKKCGLADFMIGSVVVPFANTTREIDPAKVIQAIMLRVFAARSGSADQIAHWGLPKDKTMPNTIPLDAELNKNNILAYACGQDIQGGKAVGSAASGDPIRQHQDEDDFKAIFKASNKGQKSDLADRYISKFMQAGDPEKAEYFARYFDNPASGSHHIKQYRGLKRYAGEIGKKYAEQTAYQKAFDIYKELTDEPKKWGLLAQLAQKSVSAGKSQAERDIASAIIQYLEAKSVTTVPWQNAQGGETETPLGQVKALVTDLIAKDHRIATYEANLLRVGNSEQYGLQNIGEMIKLLTGQEEAARRAVVELNGVIKETKNPYDQAYALYVKGALLYAIAQEHTPTSQVKFGEKTVSGQALYKEAMTALKRSWDIAINQRDDAKYRTLLERSFQTMIYITDGIKHGRYLAKEQDKKKAAQELAGIMPSYGKDGEKDIQARYYDAKVKAGLSLTPAAYRKTLSAEKKETNYTPVLDDAVKAATTLPAAKPTPRRAEGDKVIASSAKPVGEKKSKGPSGEDDLAKAMN
ncbi:MAG: hypothetical protein MUC35_01585 [Candidatus Margulisbacteria bacterium]|jgi:hypothetical protein|nr:hypothetical protein [Candidatus Margulisiibacteriota bacterium]